MHRRSRGRESPVFRPLHHRLDALLGSGARLRRKDRLPGQHRQPGSHNGANLHAQAAAPFTMPCGSITNFLAAPLSKSLYPWGALFSEMVVTLTALAICTLS